MQGVGGSAVKGGRGSVVEGEQGQQVSNQNISGDVGGV